MEGNRGAVRRLLPAACLALAAQLNAQSRDPQTLAIDSLLDVKVSTASKYAQRIGEVASSVTIVTSEDIERYGYRTLDDVLATIPGFYTSNDRNYTYIGVRGFSRPTDYNNRILVLIDGNTVNEAIWGSAPMGGELSVPMRALERVEIVRGPGSALYGTGAIFGVINLITKAPATLDGAEISAEGGMYGRRAGNLLLGRRFAGGAGLSLIGSWEASDGRDLFFTEYNAPETHDGLAQSLDWERRGALLATVTNAGFSLHGRFGTRTKAVPTGAYETVFNAPGSKTRDDYAFIEGKYERTIDPTRQISVRAYFNHYFYEGGYPYETETAGVVAPNKDSGRDEAAGSEATLRWDIASANRLTVGAEVRRNLRSRYMEAEGGPEQLVRFDTPSTVLSGYVQDEHQLLSALSVLGGVRFDRYSASVQALSPRLAMILTPAPGMVLKLLYGQAFRSPSAYEAEVQSGLYQKNPDIRPERARTLEAVWQQRLGRGLLSTASVFQYRVDGLIDLTTDSVTTLYTYRNVGRARSRGAEIAVEARLPRALSGFANYTYQRTTDEHGARLTNSPAQLLRTGVGLDLWTWFRPALQLRRESSRLTVYDTRTPAYTVVDVNIIVTPLRQRSRSRRDLTEGLELTLRLTNAFDAAYATPGGVEHRQPAIWQDGRTLRAEIRYRF
jgi:iron complex outermembrane receptor protein